MPINFFDSLRPSVAVGALALAAWAGPLQAQPVIVPNFSFASPTAPTTSPFVNIFVDSWQKIAEPAYYGPAIGTPFGIPWLGTAGVFFDTNPYLNREGIQAGYLLAFPEVTLFQDYNSSPAHDFNVTYEIGKAYNLTIGVFGKPTLAPGNTLEVSLYYLDDLDNRVTVAATTITYSDTIFPGSGPFSLVDFEVNVPAVEAGDPWAGRHLGVQLESTVPLASASGGNWDFDNARLTVVPEPATWTLLGFGAGALLLVRTRARRRT